MKINIACTIAGGKLDLNKERFSLLLANCKSGRYNLTIEPETNNISEQQRRYFYGVIIDRIRLGFLDKGIVSNIEEIKYILKELALHRFEYSEILQQDIKVHISLGKNEKGLTKEEFSVMKVLIQNHAITEWGIDIPEPNEIDYSTK